MGQRTMNMANNFHERFDRKESAKISSDRNFCFTFAFLFTAIGSYQLIHGNSGVLLIIFACIIAGVAVISPAMASPINSSFTKLGHALASISNPLFLGFIHVTTIRPIGFLMRLVGKHPLRLNYAPTAKSYWIERDPTGPEAETMKNQF